MKGVLRCSGLLILSIFFLAACERTIETEPKEDIVPTALTLKAEEVGDSIIISWQADQGKFEYFKLFWNWQTETPPMQHYEFLLDGHVNRHALKFMAPIPLNGFRVAGYLKSGTEILSNLQEIRHPELLPIQFSAFDALMDSKQLYLFDITGNVLIYDVDKYEILKKQAVGDGRIGYCDFGVFNNQKELYVPCLNGNLYIYSAANLELIDQINIGYPLHSVAYNNGMLFVSTDQNFNNPLKIYSRREKSLISAQGFYGTGRLKLVPGSNTQLVEITNATSPAIATFYAFDANGAFVTKKQDTYHGTYNKSGGLFYMYPDGSRFISSGSGTIFNNTMNIEYVLSTAADRNIYLSFCVSNETDILYAGKYKEKKVDMFAATGYSFKKSVETPYFPRWLFRVNNKTLVIGSLYAPPFWSDQLSKFYLTYLNE